MSAGEIITGSLERPGLASIRTMWALHWPRTQERHPPPDVHPQRLLACGPFVDTCLRCLSFGAGTPPPPEERTGAQFLAGADAWRFVLEVACGLHSEIPGETNVFGQIRRSVQTFNTSAPATRVRMLRPMLDALITDVRHVRRQHLGDIGGNSYGSLVRRLLRAERSERILFVGTGELAASMLPLFRDFPTATWNRHPRHAGNPPGPFARVRPFAPAEAEAAAAWADHLVMTTPPDPAHDSAWYERVRNHEVRTLVHLGHRHSDALPAWPGLRRYALDSVFETGRTQARFRALQVRQALRECRLRARVRLAAEQPQAAEPRLIRA